MTDDHTQNPKERLATPAQFIKGVGPHRAKMLARLGLRTVTDLLFYFPRDYRDGGCLRHVSQLRQDQMATVTGVIDEIDIRNTGVGRTMLGVLIRQDNHFLRALWFNQPFMRDRLNTGDRVVVSGKPRNSGGRWEMVHPRVETLDADDQPSGNDIEPIYALTTGLRQFAMRRLIREVVAEYADFVEEAFPEDFLTAHHVMPIGEALRQIHGPSSQEALALAKRRFCYQELFVLQLAVALRRQQLLADQTAAPLECTAKIDARIRRLFPFDLTDEQNAAIREMTADMGRRTPMNRMLQGDVGNGKTVVAEYAMLLAVAHGCQAAIMAPTEVLARQHARTLAHDLRESRVRLGLLTGATSAAQRRERLAGIASGEINLIVGTHALLHSDVKFARLALVIVDEQHKFGVRQRAALRQSGLAPHYLVMTATPIPRTVSMTLFGDLELSSLRRPPPGRAMVHTYRGDENQREKWWSFFRKKLREGRQGYVIAPRVEEADEDDEVRSVQAAFESLANGELESFKLDLLHGRMNASEKDAVMQEFHGGRTQVLVATSVVEVGINVPNATLMTIEDGQRFGLAQLHQLRGRISRGKFPGYLCVFADANNEEAESRLDAFVRTNDGFELAEIDFQLRGPGDLFGSQQHGMPSFRVADLQRDTNILIEARKDAQELLARDPELRRSEFQRLRRMVLARYGRALELADVG